LNEKGSKTGEIRKSPQTPLMVDAGKRKEREKTVRATARRYLIRIAASGDTRIRKYILRRLNEDESIAVRQAILEEIKEKWQDPHFAHYGGDRHQ
jgi:hypothetical protein